MITRSKQLQDNKRSATSAVSSSPQLTEVAPSQLVSQRGSALEIPQRPTGYGPISVAL